MDELRVLIVDDEPNAVRGLSRILANRNELRIVGATGSGAEAVELIRELQPHVVLLDVEMPGMSGFDVVSKIGKNAIPFLIFVTAHEEFALQAFEVHAFDYIVKPVDHVRLYAALDRAREHNDRSLPRDRYEQIQSLLRTVSAIDVTPVESPRRLSIKSQGTVILVSIDEITRIESAGNYVRYFVDGEVYLSRATMNQVQDQLSMTSMKRVHRSRIVNCDRIKKITHSSNGEFEITLDDGAQVLTGRRYRDDVRQLMHP